MHPSQTGGCACGGLPSVFFVRDDGFSGGYELESLCHEAHHGNVRMVNTEDLGTTWEALDTFDVTPVEGDPTVRPVTATMFFTNYLPGGVGVEYRFADGAEEMLCQYVNMHYFQKHRITQMKLVDYNLAATALTFQPYPCLDPFYAVLGSICSSPCADQLAGAWALYAIIQTAVGTFVISNCEAGFPVCPQEPLEGFTIRWALDTVNGGVAVSIQGDGDLVPSATWAVTGVANVCSLAIQGFAFTLPLASGGTPGFTCAAGMTSVTIQFFAMDQDGRIIGSATRITCPEDPPPCQGRSTWKLTRQPCSFTGQLPKYLYRWQHQSNTCSGGYDCEQLAQACNPSPPFDLSEAPLTDAQAEALGYIDRINVDDDSGDCGCGENGYVPPECPEVCEGECVYEIVGYASDNGTFGVQVSDRTVAITDDGTPSGNEVGTVYIDLTDDSCAGTVACGCSTDTLYDTESGFWGIGGFPSDDSALGNPVEYACEDLP